MCVCVWVDVWRREGGRCGVHVEGGYVWVNITGKRCKINVSSFWSVWSSCGPLLNYSSMLICVWCYVEGASIRVIHVDIYILSTYNPTHYCWLPSEVV